MKDKRKHLVKTLWEAVVGGGGGLQQQQTIKVVAGRISLLGSSS